jgi:hypothetical protein
MGPLCYSVYYVCKPMCVPGTVGDPVLEKKMHELSKVFE